MQACFDSMLLSNKRAARIIASANNDTNCEPVGPVSEHHICCTDVTGFGLLGHLIEMLKYGDGALAKSEDEFFVEERVGDGYETDPEAENVAVDASFGGVEATKAGVSALPAAVLTTSQIPLIPGATDCIEKGVFSTLQPQNLRCKHALEERSVSNTKISALSLYPLLFDPQTSGGLLATVPAHHATRVIRELHAYGYPDSTIIGHVVQRDIAKPDVLVYLED
jgi:selenophosphate synthase